MTLRPILALLLLAGGLVVAQQPKAGPAPTPADKKFGELLTEVRKLASTQQNEKALEKLAEAEALQPNNPVTHNARGSIHTSMKDFARARESFIKAQALSPNAFESRFNLTELEFVQGNYETAAAEFTKIIEAHPNLPQQIRVLVQFKVLVCKLKVGKVADAEELLKTYAFKEESPAAYLTKATLAIQKGDSATANSWLEKAQKTFKQGETLPYIDALVEAKWISFTGNKEAKK